MVRYLCSAFAATAIAIFCLASPASAWSTSDGAVSIHATSSYSGSVPAVQVDSAGNIYACGHFRTTSSRSYDVDPNPAVTVNVSVAGLDSSVISKYSPSGNLLYYLIGVVSAPT